MAEIVILNKWRSERAARRSEIKIGEGADAAAQLLLFTGVRYERFDDNMDRKAQNHAVGAE